MTPEASPLKIVICDDEHAQRETLRACVKDWAKTQGINITFSEYENAEKYLFNYEEDVADILLLDIQMGEMDGVTLAKKIRAVNKEVQIIFITGFPAQ